MDDECLINYNPYFNIPNNEDIYYKPTWNEYLDMWDYHYEFDE